MNYLLDTGVLLRAVNQPGSIPANPLSLLKKRGESFALSAISLWEIGKKHQLGKLNLPTALEAWFDLALTSQIEVIPIDSTVIAEAMNLPAFPNRDPADEIIVATARVHQLILLTTDSLLKNYRHARIKYFKPRQT